MREGAGGVLPRTPAVAFVAVAAVAVLSAAAPPVLLESLAGRQIFPATNWWNQDVSAAPLDSSSAAYISWIGTTKSLHPDFGPPPYGIPYVVVAGDQARVPVTFRVRLGERHRHSGAGGLSDT